MADGDIEIRSLSMICHLLLHVFGPRIVLGGESACVVKELVWSC